MEYKVIRGFTDRVDNHKYAVGDRYPYRGFARKERVAELSSTRNRRGVILIEVAKKVVEAKVETKNETAEEETVESVGKRKKVKNNE